MKLPPEILVEADFFISYLRDDWLATNVEKLILLALDKEIILYLSSEVYDDLITAYLSKGFNKNQIKQLLTDIRSIPHITIPVTNEIAIIAMDLYIRYGGRRKLHYFDSFHVATAKVTSLPLLTSDKYIIKKAKELNIKVLDLRQINSNVNEYTS